MTYTILLVDDVQINRLVMENILSKSEEPLEFIHASNGEVAKDILDTFSVDLVVSDLMMPQMDGFSLIKWMKSKTHTQQIPIMIYTASHDLASIKTCLNLGITDYFFKPLSQAEVQVIVPLKVKQALMVYEKQKMNDKLCGFETKMIQTLLLENRRDMPITQIKKQRDVFMHCFYNKSKKALWLFLIKVLNEAAPPVLPLFLMALSKKHAGKTTSIREVKENVIAAVNDVSDSVLEKSYEIQIGKIECHSLYLEELGSFQLSFKLKNGQEKFYKDYSVKTPIPLKQVESLIFFIPPLNQVPTKDEWAYKYSFAVEENTVNIGLVDNLQEM